jgi:hypothetical protein
MPRRLPVRPAKILGNFFVLFILFIIFFVYYAFVIVVWGPKANGKYNLIIYSTTTKVYLYHLLPM